jgi:methionyl-tRNA synthetase
LTFFPTWDILSIFLPTVLGEILNLTKLRICVNLSKRNWQGQKMETINFDDFNKIDLRVGEILTAEKIPQTQNLLRLVVDFGKLGKKKVITGIFRWYKPEELVGKQAVFVFNLAPKEIRGELSEAMILTAEQADGSYVIIVPQKKSPPGAKVF